MNGNGRQKWGWYRRSNIFQKRKGRNNNFFQTEDKHALIRLTGYFSHCNNSWSKCSQQGRLCSPNIVCHMWQEALWVSGWKNRDSRSQELSWKEIFSWKLSEMGQNLCNFIKMATSLEISKPKGITHRKSV